MRGDDVQQEAMFSYLSLYRIRFSGHKFFLSGPGD